MMWNVINSVWCFVLSKRPHPPPPCSLIPAVNEFPFYSYHHRSVIVLCLERLLKSHRGTIQTDSLWTHLVRQRTLHSRIKFLAQRTLITEYWGASTYFRNDMVIDRVINWVHGWSVRRLKSKTIVYFNIKPNYMRLTKTIYYLCWPCLQSFRLKAKNRLDSLFFFWRSQLACPVIN